MVNRFLISESIEARMNEKRIKHYGLDDGSGLVVFSICLVLIAFYFGDEVHRLTNAYIGYLNRQ